MLKQFYLRAGMVVLFTGLLAFTGCSESVSNEEWARTIPGVYQGTDGDFREVLEFKSSGRYAHEVFIGDRSTFSESGDWTYQMEMGILKVEPFTSFYDDQNHRIMRQGLHRPADAIFINRSGNAADKISSSGEYRFCLVKKK